MVFMGDVDGLRRGELQILDTATLPHGPEVDALLNSGVHHYMVVPMIANGELIGGLSFGGEPDQFSPEQIGMAREVAAQLAIGIAHARLYERVMRQTEELEQRVQERTLALHASNEQLQNEIVERRRAEAEAARANRLKSEFLANMSHELRTPLNAILGFSELIHDGQVTPEMPEYKEFLADILASGRHLLQLINDVLDLSKVEAGKLEFHPEAVDIARLAAEVISVLRATAAAKSIRIESEIHADLGDVILDGGRFKQVLYNYISNALKFTPDGGRVVVRARPDVRSGSVRVEVDDNGIGIAAEDLGRLFVEFERSWNSNSSTQARRSITPERVSASRSPSAWSKHREGPWASSVRPAREARSTQSFPTTLWIEQRRRSTVTDDAILIVEDNPTNMKLLAFVLTSRGYDVRTARDAFEARSVLAASRPRMILLDLQLPGMDGLAFVRQLRTDPSTSSIPVVAVTAYAMKGDEQKALDAGCDGYVTKPIDTRALLALVARHVAGRSDAS
jgi:signal transduction histidine kinase/CheY-like chemotaxis protein